MTTCLQKAPLWSTFVSSNGQPERLPSLTLNTPSSFAVPLSCSFLPRHQPRTLPEQQSASFSHFQKSYLSRMLANQRLSWPFLFLLYESVLFCTFVIPFNPAELQVMVDEFPRHKLMNKRLVNSFLDLVLFPTEFIELVISICILNEGSVHYLYPTPSVHEKPLKERRLCPQVGRDLSTFFLL